jgi:lysophospholipase L1-like esterase
MPKANPRPISTRRRWLFRAGAVLAGLSLFVLVEVACRVFDLGHPQPIDDPFVGFSELQPLFELNKTEARYEIPKPRLKFFVEESFPERKPPGTFRIFCLGGSTVQGRPFSKETSFTTFLEIGLGEADPSRDWEVINCGGISYASYRLVPMLEECLNYEPDLFIICTGHNEFLEDRSYGHLRNVAPIAAAPLKAAFQMRSFHLARSLFLPPTIQPQADETRPELGPDVQARLDYRGGLKEYVRDEEWRAGVMRHFAFNVNRLLQTAQQRRVPVVLVLPPSNLADSPPFKSLPKNEFTKAEQEQHSELIETARRLQKNDPHGAVVALEEALKLDDRQAAVYYFLGRLLERVGETSRARAAYVEARDQDICPLRILSPMEDALKSAASEWRVPLLDAHALLEARIDDGLLDNSWLVDHVHPSISGHEQIALGLIQLLSKERVASAQANWQQKAAEQFERHRDDLPTVYFLKGEQRLENLRYWARGMVEGMRRPLPTPGDPIHLPGE